MKPQSPRIHPKNINIIIALSRNPFSSRYNPMYFIGLFVWIRVIRRWP